MKTAEQATELNSYQQFKPIQNSKEVEESGVTIPEGKEAPKPIKCEFCGKTLYYLALVIGRKVHMWMTQPPRCDCKAAVEYWEAQDAIEVQRRKEETLRNEREQRQIMIEHLNGSSGIKKRFVHRTFEKFKITPQNREAYEMAKKYADNFEAFFADGYGIYFEGTKGTGKTHLAVAIALQLLNNCIPVIFRTSIDLLAELRRTYGKDATANEDYVMGTYSTADLLIIDDLGKEKPSKWTADRLFAIINDRYENMKPTIITTNYGQSSLIDRLTPEGADSTTAEAIISRLQECCSVVTMIGDDWRIK